MHFLHLLTFLLLIGVANPGRTQPHPLTGFWTGYLTQEEGGYRPRYRFEMTLEQSGSTVTGISFSRIDTIFAEMKVKGTISGNTLQFSETGLSRFSPLKNMSWCLKSGQLQLSQKGKHWVLEGSWHGKSAEGACVPGKIYLVKSTPRA